MTRHPLVHMKGNAMNRMITIFVLLFVFGCEGDYTDPVIIAQNKTRLSQAGQEVGVLPDGRKVIRYELDMGRTMHNHWIYVVDGSLSINQTQSHGKTTANHVHVVIEGQNYKLVPTTETDQNR